MINRLERRLHEEAGQIPVVYLLRNPIRYQRLPSSETNFRLRRNLHWQLSEWDYDIGFRHGVWLWEWSVRLLDATGRQLHVSKVLSVIAARVVAMIIKG